MTLKVFTAFSGYDSQCMALDRMKINYELVGWSEIDKYAIMAHNAIYPQYKDRNFGVPQNRERVFMVSILGDAWFDFPKPFQSDKKLKDLLYEPINNKYFRIRKLTEKGCFRLMDVSDENINKIQNSGISKTQQYKMAGNSIVVNVLYFIFKNLFKQ